MDYSKLAKVLALAASDNPTEALHALTTARRLLEAEGADFVELARRLAEAEAVGNGGVDREVLEDAIFDLRNEIRHLRSENERLKQGRGMPAAGVAEPPSFQDAARAAADVIRLRAELDEAAGHLARAEAAEAELRRALAVAEAEGATMAARLAEADARRMRLEVENRRLSHANHALGVELREAQEAAAPRAERKPKAPPRARPAASQYALF
jgi:chromosome segregation ATPase